MEKLVVKNCVAETFFSACVCGKCISLNKNNFFEVIIETKCAKIVCLLLRGVYVCGAWHLKQCLR